MAKLTYPDGNVVDYTYTARNQLKEVHNGGPPPVAIYGYDLSIQRRASGDKVGKWSNAME